MYDTYQAFWCWSLRNVGYIVNMIEKLSGSGRDGSGNPIPGITVERWRGGGAKWMLTLQTVIPYGLGGRVGDECMAEKDSGVVGNGFLPLHCLYRRPEYDCSKNELDTSFLKQNFVKVLTPHLDHNFKRCWLFYSCFHQIFWRVFLGARM